MIDLEDLKRAAGAHVVKLGDDVFAERHMRDFGAPPVEGAEILAAAFPTNAQEAAAVLSWCNARGVPVVPQGGMTGLVGGGNPAGRCVVLSLERMRTIEEIDPAASTMTVQAGVTLQAVQEAADAAGFLFPLDLGGRGTAQIGGNASTNAGGNRVLRYGMMRDLVLGVEAVLADGTIVSNLNKMIKNNAGYDLKQLFLGSEGTLGVITRLVLRVYPKPSSQCTALCAMRGTDDALALLARLKAGVGESLSAFELMWPEFYRVGTSALGRVPPIPEEHGLYVLTEILGTDQAADQERFEAVIGAAVEAGVVSDAVIAQSKSDVQKLWAVRDCPGEFPKVHWPQLGFDVSAPIGDMDGFMKDCRATLQARWPKATTLYFGHLADSNLHISVRLDEHVGTAHEVDEALYEVVGRWKGSISAEHGIGIAKRPYLKYSRSEAELDVMRRIKAALDPKNILNPGKVI
ncbi:MAG: FAD-binding oxidoreductase [Hyphomonadaceae bacterium]|nr:FAD-binding oxidoreductase [Hyphomonadaceae bacterium]